MSEAQLGKNPRTGMIHLSSCHKCPVDSVMVSPADLCRGAFCGDCIAYTPLFGQLHGHRYMCVRCGKEQYG